MGEKSKLFLGCVVLFLLTAMTGFAQEEYRTRIAIVPMVNNTGDPQYDAVCETVTDTVGLVIQFLKDYLLITADEKPILARLPDAAADTLSHVGEEEGFDEIIFGTAELRSGGGFIFSLSIFNTFEGKVQIEETETAETLFDIFDAADRITLALISQVSDIHIGFGAIQLERGGGYGTFEVFLDDKPVHNYKRVFRKVLNGTYDLSIRQNRLLGKTVVFRKQIEVLENQTVLVTFDIPGASPEEFQFLEDEASALSRLAVDSENIESFLTGIAEFQRKTQRTGYDRELENTKNDILHTVGETAVKVLDRLKESGDASYVQTKPDFAAALAKYNEISDLLNNIYEYQIIDDEELELKAPSSIAAAGEETFFALDESKGFLIIRSFDFSGKQLAELQIDTAATDFPGGICTDTYGKLFYCHPEDPEITVFDRNLNIFAKIPIPDFDPPGIEAAGKKQAVKFTRSESGVCYILGTEEAIVFDPAGEADPDTDEIVVSRRTDAERALAARLREEGISEVSSLFFDKADRLNVYSAETGLLLRFDVLGNFHSKLSFPDSEKFSRLAVDSLGYFYLTLPEANRIKKYNPAGEPVTEFGEYGDGPGQYSWFRGIDIAEDGTVLVADTFNRRLQIQRLSAPPVLFPSVSQYGVSFGLRTGIAEKAIEKMDRSMERVKAGPIAGGYIGAGIFIGGAFGLHYTADMLKANYLADYADYREASAVQEAMDLHSAANIQWYLSLIADIGNLTSFGIGSMLLTSAVLNTVNAAGMRGRVVRNLQSLSLDKEYELDRNKYKSLRTTQSIGFWTGIFPVLAGAAAIPAYLAVNSYVLHSSDIDYTLISAIALASVAVPPIFSHLYGGKFHFGLLTAGLISDAMALAALLMIRNAGEEGHPAFRQNPAPGPVSPANTLARIEERLPLYLMIGAMCTRIAAGAWDRNHGWVRAHEYNRYRADTAAGSADNISFSLLPAVTEQGRYGLAVNLSY